MPRIARYIGTLVTVCAPFAATPVIASDSTEQQQDNPTFALMDLRGTTAWAITNFQWLEPAEETLDVLIANAGTGNVRLDFVMNNIVPPYCELRPNPEICDGPGTPVSWMEDVPQTICMDIPSPIRARHKAVLSKTEQLCLQPTSNLMFPKGWADGTIWDQLHLQQSVAPGKVRVEDDTAIIDLVISDAIATRFASLSEQEYGPIMIGWDQETLRKNLGPRLDQFVAGDDENCTYLQRNHDPSGLGYLVLDGRLARISLYADEYDVATSLVKTTQGIALGSTRDDILATYDRAALVEEEHEYLGGNARYITWWADQGKTRGIRFELNEDGLVTAIHAGSDAITLLEGCS
ncbi:MULTISPECIES: hypothetical protein [Thalassospira]|uniref:Uncharacterized protein n=2 Tax=Thalassospira TaxID=168934 RepID=A0A367W422_9PROT|nr:MULTISPECIES: hypothetical protein [Thalassospira]MDG4721189.1 hypothetical protein [Thalassospira sp. FZY0004]RCK33712.1 hypothetical protein TH19_17555 [Thalassospira profundimaris]